MNHIHAYHKEGYYLSESFFILNFITWFISRLYLFPRAMIIHVAPYAKSLYPDWKLYSITAWSKIPMLQTQIILCWVLIVLHMYNILLLLF